MKCFRQGLKDKVVSSLGGVKLVSFRSVTEGFDFPGLLFKKCLIINHQTCSLKVRVKLTDTGLYLFSFLQILDFKTGLVQSGFVG